MKKSDDPNYRAMSTPDLVAWLSYYQSAGDRWGEVFSAELERNAGQPPSDLEVVALLQERKSRAKEDEVWKVIQWRDSVKALPPNGLIGWSRQWIDQVKFMVPLADLIAEDGVVLSRDYHQRESVGLCPFHADTSPSLHVSAENLWYCYGCRQGGDAITWLMQKRGLSFRAAVTLLAEKAHMELPDDGAVSPARVMKVLRRHLKTGE